MSGDVAGWVLSRRRQALRRVRLAGLAAVLILCLAGGWLGWREWKLEGLDLRTATTMREWTAGSVLIDLKQLALTSYLAKLKQNKLLADITGNFDLEGSCAKLPDLRGLPRDSACAANWDKALSVIWESAYGPQAQPVPERLKRDPWGSPYLLNQGEIVCGMFGAWCPSDTIRSVGPDGKADTPDDIQTAIAQHLGPSRIKVQ